MLKAGDIFLVKEYKNWISEGITWMSPRFSHCEPVMNSEGVSLNVGLWTPKVDTASRFFKGKHRVAWLRPKEGKFDYADIIEDIYLKGFEYDLGTFWSHLIGRDKENPKKDNCSEACLRMLKEAGHFKDLSYERFSPSDLMMLAYGGGLEILGQWVKPEEDIWKQVII